MALMDSRVVRAIVAGLFGIAFSAVCVTGWWAYTYLRPVWDVRKAVQAKLGDAESPAFEHVSFNKATGVGCGFVDLKTRADGPAGKTHFILFPSGELRFEPKIDPKQTDAAQQVAALQKQVDYAKLLETSCFR